MSAERLVGAAAAFFLGGGTPTLTLGSAKVGHRRRLTIDSLRSSFMAFSSDVGRAGR